MTPERPRPAWLVRTAIILLLVLIGPVFWAFVVNRILAQAPLGSTHPGGWTPLALGVGTLIWAFCIAGAAIAILPQYLTNFTPRGLRAPHPFGARDIAWVDVNEVYIGPMVVAVKAGKTVAHLHLRSYTPVAGVLPFLQAQLPPTVRWYRAV